MNSSTHAPLPAPLPFRACTAGGRLLAVLGPHPLGGAGRVRRALHGRRPLPVLPQQPRPHARLLLALCGGAGGVWLLREHTVCDVARRGHGVPARVRGVHGARVRDARARACLVGVCTACLWVCACAGATCEVSHKKSNAGECCAHACSHTRIGTHPRSHQCTNTRHSFHSQTQLPPAVHAAAGRRGLVCGVPVAHQRSVAVRGRLGQLGARDRG